MNAGSVELKLCDDNGDLELWIARDPKIKEPFDLPLDAAIKVEFIDVGNLTVELKVRNAGKNEGEEGTGTFAPARRTTSSIPARPGPTPHS